MLFTHASLLLTALLAPVTFCTPHSSRDNAVADASSNIPTSTTSLSTTLQKLLAQADRVVLHAALHESYSSFTDGTHENDLAAIEAIHRSSPPLATRIVELARRQIPISNSTFTTSTGAGATTTHAATTEAATTDAATTAGADASSMSDELLLTTYTDSSGHVFTATRISVVAVAVPTGQAGSEAKGSESAASATASGRLQSGGERAAGLGLQALGIAALVGLLGMI